MRRNEDIFIRCLVNLDSMAQNASGEYAFARSVRKLVASELTDAELCELGFKVSRTEAPGEQAITVDPTACGAQTTGEMIDATMNVIAEQIKNLDLEAEMMVLRKRALKRRLRILERLSKSLKPGNEDHKAA